MTVRSDRWSNIGGHSYVSVRHHYVATSPHHHHHHHHLHSFLHAACRVDGFPPQRPLESDCTRETGRGRATAPMARPGLTDWRLVDGKRRRRRRDAAMTPWIESCAESWWQRYHQQQQQQRCHQANSRWCRATRQNLQTSVKPLICWRARLLRYYRPADWCCSCVACVWQPGHCDPVWLSTDIFIVLHSSGKTRACAYSKIGYVSIRMIRAFCFRSCGRLAVIILIIIILRCFVERNCCTALSGIVLLWCIDCILLTSTYATYAKIEYIIRIRTHMYSSENRIYRILVFELGAPVCSAQQEPVSEHVWVTPEGRFIDHLPSGVVYTPRVKKHPIRVDNFAKY